jgi:hypothetical protein
MVDFRELLAKPIDDLKRPPPPPAGTYYGTVASFKFSETRWENEDGEKDLLVTYALKGIEPGPDVLALGDGVMADVKLEGKLRAELPVTGPNAYVTKLFLDSLGIARPGAGFGELCPEATGHAVMFDIVHRPNKTDPTAPPFTDVRNLRKRP